MLRAVHNISSAISRLRQRCLKILFPPKPEAEVLFECSAGELRDMMSPAPRIALPDTIALFSYSDRFARALVWEIKFRGSRELAKKAAVLICDELVARLSDEALFAPIGRPLLIAVPLAEERLKDRGFNQCDLLCREIIRAGGHGVFEYRPELLAKNRHTESQTGQNRQDRMRNIRGCFNAPRPDLIKGRSVILLDDVITTGATISEARRALFAAGASRVIAAAVAH